MEFEEFVAARGHELMRLAWLLTGDHGTAEDLVQSALLDVYRRWDRVSRAESPDAYVRRALLNRHLTARRRFWHREVPTDLHSAPDRVVASETAFDDAVATRSEIGTAVAALGPRTRAVIVLRYYEHRSDEEIANLLEISASSVRSAASRGLADLRKRLMHTRLEQS